MTDQTGACGGGGPVAGILSGLKVDGAKVIRAKALRRRMTEEETVLWRSLRTNQLNGLHFRRQQVIDGFIVDFYCHTARLVVEVVGAVHQDRERASFDAERDRLLSQRGLRLLRIPNHAIRENLPTVLTQIAEAANVCLQDQIAPDSIATNSPLSNQAAPPPSLKGRGKGG